MSDWEGFKWSSVAAVFKAANSNGWVRAMRSAYNSGKSEHDSFGVRLLHPTDRWRCTEAPHNRCIYIDTNNAILRSCDSFLFTSVKISPNRMWHVQLKSIASYSFFNPLTYKVLDPKIYLLGFTRFTPISTHMKKKKKT